jgi:hypothetical protein
MKNWKIICLIILCFTLTGIFAGCGGGGSSSGEVNLPGTWRATSTPASTATPGMAGTYENISDTHVLVIIICTSGNVYTHFQNNNPGIGYREFGFGQVTGGNNIQATTIGLLPGQRPFTQTITALVSETAISGSWVGGPSFTASLKNEMELLKGFAGEYKGSLYRDEATDSLWLGVGNEGTFIGISMDTEETEYGGVYGSLFHNGMVNSETGILVSNTAAYELRIFGSIANTTASGSFMTLPSFTFSSTSSSSSLPSREPEQFEVYNVFK